MPDSNSVEAHFEPWIGANYRSRGFHGKRLLILGESHYEWLDNQRLDSNWTRDFIESGFTGDKHRFRTRVAAVVCGRALESLDEIRAFWDAVAFANYIPVSVGQGPSARPSEAMWEAAVPRFASLVAELAPHFVLVLGHSLWARMHYTFSMDGRLERHQNDMEEYRIWRYRYASDQTMLACAIEHPSRRFNFRKWHPFVSAMLKAA